MSYGNEDRLNNKLPVVKKNPLIEAKFKMSVLEYKLVVTAMSKIKKSDTELKEISYTVEEFCALVDSKADGMYSFLRRTCSNLVGKTVTLKKKNGEYIVYPWLHHVRYEKGKGMVHIQFHEYLAPLLLYVKDNVEYTKYLLENITKCNSIYSMRIYELLKQYQKLGKRAIDIPDLREMLGIETKEYKLYADFKRNVLFKARDEINKSTDIVFDFEEIYTGKKVTSILFFIRAKNPYTLNQDVYLDALPMEKLAILLKNEIAGKFVVSINEEVLAEYNRMSVLTLIKEIRMGKYDNNTGIKSWSKFFLSVLDKYDNDFIDQEDIIPESGEEISPEDELMYQTNNDED